MSNVLVCECMFFSNVCCLYIPISMKKKTKHDLFVNYSLISDKVSKSAFAKLVALKRAGCCPFRREGVQAA